MKYTISFETPYSLDAYEAATLQECIESIERQIKSFISNECQVYITENEQYKRKYYRRKKILQQKLKE